MTRKKRKIGPVSLQEICVVCNERLQGSNGRGGFRATCHPCNKGKWNTPEKAREYQYKYLYGISLNEYESMFECQDGVCKICKQLPEFKGNKRLFVDHDHQTGEVRGLLCFNCNALLGNARDSIEVLTAAIDYLS